MKDQRGGRNDGEEEISRRKKGKGDGSDEEEALVSKRGLVYQSRNKNEKMLEGASLTVVLFSRLL